MSGTNANVAALGFEPETPPASVGVLSCWSLASFVFVRRRDARVWSNCDLQRFSDGAAAALDDSNRKLHSSSQASLQVENIFECVFIFQQAFLLDTNGAGSSANVLELLRSTVSERSPPRRRMPAASSNHISALKSF